MNPFKMPEIDPETIERMIDSLSPDQKESLEKMAGNLMDAFGDFPFEQAIQPETESEESISLESFGVDGIVMDLASSRVLDTLESALELEDFYEEAEEADFSPIVLLYLKAVLFTLQDHVFSALESSPQGIEHKDLGFLLSYLQKEEIKAQLDDLEMGIDPILMNLLPVYLARAQYDWLSRQEAQFLKDQLVQNSFFIRNIKK